MLYLRDTLKHGAYLKVAMAAAVVVVQEKLRGLRPTPGLCLQPAEPRWSTCRMLKKLMSRGISTPSASGGQQQLFAKAYCEIMPRVTGALTSCVYC